MKTETMSQVRIAGESRTQVTRTLQVATHVSLEDNKTQ